MNSKGFRMRRDHEAQQELGMPDERLQSSASRPEQRLADQNDPSTRKRQYGTDRPSLLTRLWRSIKN